jgi:hypothetical protein
MSTRDREPEPQGPLKYAPKRARMAAPEPAPGGDRPGSEPLAPNVRPPERRPPPRRPPPPPAPRPREPAPPWKVTKRKGSFEGDVAIKELRERMALAPDLPPEPPLRETGGSAFGIVGRLAGLVTMAAVAAYLFVWISTPRPPVGDGFALAAYDDPATGGQPGAAPDGLGAEAAGPIDGSFSPADFQSPSVPAAGLDAADVLRPRDEPPPIDRPRGLAPVPLSTGATGRDLAARPRETPTTGVAVLSGAPAPAASVRRSPPAEAEIRTVPPEAAAPRFNTDEIATLLARGRTYLANGDVAAARLALRRAAESGDAQAALALGGTFDPLVLRSLGAVGVAADPAQARSWYQKAAELGSRDAPQRLDQLARSGR